jgi:hypothetical protein
MKCYVFILYWKSGTELSHVCTSYRSMVKSAEKAAKFYDMTRESLSGCEQAAGISRVYGNNRVTLKVYRRTMQ